MFDDLEINPIAFLLAVVGAGFGYWMAGFMNPNTTFLFRIITALLVGVVGYFISSFIANR